MTEDQMKDWGRAESDKLLRGRLIIEAEKIRVTLPDHLKIDHKEREETDE